MYIKDVDCPRTIWLRFCTSLGMFVYINSKVVHYYDLVVICMEK